MQILVARIGALGDTLMATPTVTALKKRYPLAQVDFLCSHKAAALLKNNSEVGRVIPLKQRNVPFWLSPEKQRLSWRLRGTDYDFAVLLEGAKRYHSFLRRSGIREIRSFDQSPFDPSQHSILNNIRAAGLDPPNYSHDMRLETDSRHRAGVDDWLDSLPRPLVGIHVGYGPSKKKTDQQNQLRGWGLENFSQVATRLVDQGAGIIFTGSSGDRVQVERIVRRLPTGKFCVLAGRTRLSQLTMVIDHLQLLISVDSGPAHMAAALGTPLVVVWGPGKLAQTRPFSSHSPVVVIQYPVPCAPCYDTPAMRSCRFNACMQGVTPKRVIKAALKILES